jgi:hypothetical protein
VTTAFLVLTSLLVASSAMAVDFTPKGKVPTGGRPPVLNLGVLGCDNGNAFSAYYQGTDERFGNRLSFGASAQLSTVEFAHFGFGFPGPYLYDLEMWDPTSCTMIVSVDNLVAGDASASIQVETIPLCLQGIQLSGDVLVTLDPNTCLDPTDCYPDLIYDDQVNIACPYGISATAFPSCINLSTGAFLLRAEIDGCPTPSVSRTWGAVKSLYR